MQFQPSADVRLVPRNVRILTADVKKHGPTPGCPGCQAAAANKNWRSAHTAVCRTEIVEEEDSKKRRLETESTTQNMPDEVFLQKKHAGRGDDKTELLYK